jgi:Autographiviridae endonuclease VII
MGSSKQTHCINGHEFTPENTYIMPLPGKHYKERVCITCKKSRARVWHQQNKKSHLKSKREQVYGRGAWQYYKDQLEKQNHRCAVCSGHQSEFKHAFAQDHNHQTGELRGLLCGNCNQALGKLKENPVTIAAALDYVLKWNSKTSEVETCLQTSQ